jgi:hypothetical protein
MSPTLAESPIILKPCPGYANIKSADVKQLYSSIVSTSITLAVLLGHRVAPAIDELEYNDAFAGLNLIMTPIKNQNGSEAI